MSQDANKVLVDDNVRDALKAQGYETEESPRSIYSVEKLYEALSGYAPGAVGKLEHDEHLQKGILLARAAFSHPPEEPKLEVMEFTPKTISIITSNPGGSPGLTNYGATKAESQTRALERGLQILKREKQPEPCLAFKRTQFDGKTRLVWGYPYSMTCIEGLIAWPLLQEFKKGTTPMAFAMATGALGTKLRVASYHKEWAYSLDMSQFDASLSSVLIHEAFRILRTWYNLDSVEPVSGCTVRDIFNQVEFYFIHTTIVMPDGHIYIGKDHGVPSGSYFTQIIDSIANVIIVGAISSKFSLHVSKSEVFVLGDDILFWSNRVVDLDDISDYAATRLFVKVHGAEKSALYHYDEVIHFLGRDWDKGLPDLDESEILKRMIYPEKFRKYSKDPAEKQRQIRMMLLSYAATYRSAWRIAYKLIEPAPFRNVDKGCAGVDSATYLRNSRIQSVDPEHLSGLMRFLRKYVHDDDSSMIPNTALQYWL